MALNGKYTHVNEIIEIIYRDYGFEVSVPDAMEHIWTVMGLIAVPYSFIDKEETITIENYQCSLPSDFYDFSIGGIRDGDTKIPLLPASDLYFQSDSVEQDTVGDTVILEATNTVIDTEGNPVELTAYVSQIYDDLNTDKYRYQIGYNNIRVGYETGTIDISYKAFQTNADGTPAIPDNPKFIRAVTSYIASKVGMKLYLKDELSERKYEKINQEYLWAVAAAQSYGNIPDLNHMENIKNRFTRFAQSSNHFNNDFKRLNSR